MWVYIISATYLAGLAAILYLTSRICKFAWMRRLTGEKKILRIFLSLVLSVLLPILLLPVMGAINVMIVLIHLMVIWIISDCVCNMVAKKKKKTFRYYYAGVYALCIATAYLGLGWYLDHHVSRTSYRIETEKEMGQLRIVQIADAHLGNTFDGKGFARHMERIQQENPDLFVVTGDFVDDDTLRSDMVEACKALGGINATYGVYFVFGNHDKGYFNYRDFTTEDLVAELEKNGVVILQDETLLIGDRFYLVGRNDPSELHRNGTCMEMSGLVKDCSSDKYSIVLDHQPHDYAAQVKSGVDLVLSGHTHGGQLLPFIRMGEWFGIDDKIYGHRKTENTDFIVTSGISDWNIKFKTGCKSEYVVIDIKEKGL